ncbi:MAG: SDR family oxidoreductase [Candidatus Acidiferrales bacterium]
MDTWRGKWALVTGASAGIGKALATELAAGGANLVLTARRRDRLEQLSGELSAKHGVRAEVCPADLGTPSAPREIFDFTLSRGIEIDTLINNAGFGASGESTGIPIERQLEMIQVNCAAVTHLTHLYLAGMVARRRGYILILASTAAFQGVPYLSLYAATKCFDLLFAEGLAEEVRQYGVRVCALCPGQTASEFGDVAGTADHKRPGQETAEKVAHVGLIALAKGKSFVISGAMNNLANLSERLMPRSVVASFAGKMYRPKPAR